MPVTVIVRNNINISTPKQTIYSIFFSIVYFIVCFAGPFWHERKQFQISEQSPQK